jgi:hypothetical protein
MTMMVSYPAAAAAGKARNYSELVGKALVADRFALDAFPVLGELPAVERFAAAHPHALLPRGKAVQALLWRAVAEVATAYADERDLLLRRIAAFVRLRYQERQTVTAIAKAWGMDRADLSRQVSRRAVEVVAHRFFCLARSVRWLGEGEREDGVPTLTTQTKAKVRAKAS